MGWARDWEGTELGQLPRIGLLGDSPHHTVLCSAMQTGSRGRRAEGGCLPGCLLLGDWLGIGLLVESSEWFPLCHLPASFLLFNCLCPDPFLCFFSTSLSLLRREGRVGQQQAALWLCGCCLGSTSAHMGCRHTPILETCILATQYLPQLCTKAWFWA